MAHSAPSDEVFGAPAAPTGRLGAWVRWWKVRLTPQQRWSLVGVTLLVLAVLLGLGLRPATPADPLPSDALRAAFEQVPLLQTEADEPSDTAPVIDTPGRQPTKVMEALQERTIRALDVLLVTSQSQGPWSFAEAQTYCAGLQLEGLSGWRLPELGELSSLTEAGMLGPHRYWSQTAADTFGDARMVWWAKRQRTVPAVEAAHVVCVRASHGP